jgi:hypothetical protein
MSKFERNGDVLDIAIPHGLPPGRYALTIRGQSGSSFSVGFDFEP